MIYLSVPAVPISTNHAYVTGRNGIRFLTKEGKAFKNLFKVHIARQYPRELQTLRPNMPYTALVLFTFKGEDTLFCKGYATGAAENRYKPLDVSNRYKLLEDTLKEATNIDDRHYFSAGFEKNWSETAERTDIWIWNEETERSPLRELFNQLVGGLAAPGAKSY